MSGSKSDATVLLKWLLQALQNERYLPIFIAKFNVVFMIATVVIYKS